MRAADEILLFYDAVDLDVTNASFDFMIASKKKEENTVVYSTRLLF